MCENVTDCVLDVLADEVKVQITDLSCPALGLSDPKEFLILFRIYPHNLCAAVCGMLKILVLTALLRSSCLLGFKSLAERWRRRTQGAAAELVLR